MEKKDKKAEDFKAHNKAMAEGYPDENINADPAEKPIQADDAKVQNPNRNLAKGGNNSDLKDQ